MQKKIFVKLIRNNGNGYCYDIGTNSIIEIDEPLYYVLKDYNYLNRKKVIGKLIERFSRKEIMKAIDTVDKFNKDNGGFILKKPIKLLFPFDEIEYKKLLSNLVNHMVLNITEKCNFRCEYCKYSSNYTFSSTNTEVYMKWNTIKKAIDFFIRNADYIIKNTDRNLVLGFYGGEPLIEYKNIFKAVEYLKKNYKDIFNRFRFSLTTNGSLLNIENINKFIKYDFSLLVSLDGPKEIHNRYRTFINKHGSFDSIKKNLKLIKKIDENYFNKKVGFSVVLAPEFELKSIYNFFKSEDFSEDRVYLFSSVDPDGTTFFDRFDMDIEYKKLKYSEKSLKKIFISNKISNIRDVLLENLFGNTINDIHRRIPSKLMDEIYPNGICLPGLQKLFVDSNGNFHVCEKISNNFSIGNVDDGFDVGRIFGMVNKYIKTTNDCKNCWALRFCKDCYISNINEDKFSIEKKKESCKIRKRIVLNGLKDYISIFEKNQNAFEKDDYDNNIMYEAFKFLKRI